MKKTHTKRWLAAMVGLWLACSTHSALFAEPTTTDSVVPAGDSAASAAVPAPSGPADRWINGFNNEIEKPLNRLGTALGGAVFTGMVDTYAAFDFNQPASDTVGLRLFDPRANQYALNLAEFGVVKTPTSNSPFGYNFTLGYGNAMNVVNTGDTSFLRYLKEAYTSYLAPVGKGLQIDVGKFVTPDGFEVIESNSNWNYSRSLLFNYAIPFYHFGARAKYVFNDKYSLTGYVVDGWNNVTSGFVSGLHTGALSFAWNVTKKVSVTETWMGGPGATPQDAGHWRNLLDSVITYNPTSKLSLAGWGDYGRSEGTIVSSQPVKWWGAAGYVKYQFNPLYAAAIRYEYYNDPDGFTIGGYYNGIFSLAPREHIQAITATVERQVTPHVIARAEFRHDLSSAPVFQKGGLNSPVSDQSTVAGGFIFVLAPAK